MTKERKPCGEVKEREGEEDLICVLNEGHLTWHSTSAKEMDEGVTLTVEWGSPWNGIPKPRTDIEPVDLSEVVPREPKDDT